MSFLITGVSAQNVGSTAPDFNLQDTDGINFKLSEKRGKVVLVFLLGYNCTFCINSAPTVKSTILEYFAQNDNFIAIGIDTWEGTTNQVKTFKTITGLNMPILKNGSQLAQSWSVSYDRLVVIDSEGIMRHKSTQSALSSAESAKSVITDLLNNLTTDINELSSSKEFLSQNYPNPVAGISTIQFFVETAGDVELVISDISGKRISMPVSGYFPPGPHKIQINSWKLKPGIYLYSLVANNNRATRKFLVK
jgi:peroxiredoxin